MSGAQRSLPRQGDDIDVARVVRVLRHTGPLPLSELSGHPDLVGWGQQRIEDAVVAAWSRTLIFVDRADRLVAIGSPARF